MKFYINLFGDSIRYSHCSIPKEQFEKMNRVRIKNNTTWEQLLLDLDFLHHFGFAHWSEIGEFESKGFELNYKNKLEIKQQSKLVRKLNSMELYGDETFFPIYSIEKIKISSIQKEEFQQLLFVQFETGLFAKYAFETTDFDLSNMQFEIKNPLEEKRFNYLTGISYGGEKLTVSLEDSVVRGVKVILF